MKKVSLCILLMFITISLWSCADEKDNLNDDSTDTIVTEVDRNLPQTKPLEEVVKFVAEFDENEVFDNDIDKRAADFIDPYIKQAVIVLNTVKDFEPRFDILDCDYSLRPKKRDEISDPLTLHIYDTILESSLEFGDYYFNEDDYDTNQFFQKFVDATDAIELDCRYITLYTDSQMNWKTYEDGYYMPGNWLDNMSDDREAIKAEVDYYNAVVDRIVEKMPKNMDNYDKCCYFAFVISLVTEYDYDLDTLAMPYPAYPALVQQSCVCQGYAEAFYELCKRVGISCWYCTGTSSEGDHAWNRLETTEGYIYMDITWYDDDEIEDYYRQGDFFYLFMTEETLEEVGHVVQKIR